MCRADEVAAVERALNALPGVQSVKANLMQRTVAIGHDDTINDASLVAALKKSGLKDHPCRVRKAAGKKLDSPTEPASRRYRCPASLPFPAHF